MINVILFGINVIIAYVIWTYALKPSILDHFRDKLFDLRNNVRNFYMKNNIALTDDTYKNLRDSINSHLRFTEKKSLIKTVKFIHELNKNPELDKQIERSIEKMFFTKNIKLKEFIKHSRDESAMILIHYMIFSSPIMMISFFILSSVLIVKTISINIFSSAFIKNKAQDIEEYSMTHFRYNH